MNGHPATMNLKPDAKPNFFPCSESPISLEGSSQKRISQTGSSGNPRTSRPWWTDKLLSSCRLKENRTQLFNYALNLKSMSLTKLIEAYPLLGTEILFHKLNGAKLFAKNDLSLYYQIELDDEGQNKLPVIQCRDCTQ